MVNDIVTGAARLLLLFVFLPLMVVLVISGTVALVRGKVPVASLNPRTGPAARMFESCCILAGLIGMMVVVALAT